MNPDDLQQAWKVQSSQTRVTVAADLLLNEVRRNERTFRETIFRRDVIEVSVGMLLLPYWFYNGAKDSLPWTWYLAVPAIVWVIGFFLFDRLRYPQLPSDPGESLLSCARNSLNQVERQIWLLRNVFWWYLLPFAIAILAFFLQMAWVASRSWSETLGPISSIFFVFGVIYYLNQRAARSDLEPRRQELLTLIASLSDETNEADAVDEEVDAVNSTANGERSAARAHTLSLIVLLAAIAIVSSVAAHFAGRAAAGYPKVSPFAAVRWEESQPEVKVGDQWFKLVSLDGVSAGDIVRFSQRTYGEKWQKRFEEDLVEVLAGMGHEPNDAVRLVVVPLESKEKPREQTLEDVPMTEANRAAIRKAAQAR